jgi:hypothetical protein
MGRWQQAVIADYLLLENKYCENWCAMLEHDSLEKCGDHLVSASPAPFN